MSTQAKILYHPCFDAAKVNNPVIRGRKKDCISFQSALRRREAGKPLPPAPRSLPTLTTEQACNKVIGEWIAEIRDHLIRIETAGKLMASERRAAK